MKIPPIPGFQCGIPTVRLFPCQSYGEQLYWIGDQVEAPDAGNGRPALYSNYDVSYSHQFKDGLGFRLTPFYKVGHDLPTFGLVTQLPGGGGIFAASNFGFNRTTGVEASLTTPDHPVGFSGFLSATYQNVLSTTPPLSTNETNVPLLEPATLALGDLYRAGYISPFSVRIGGTYALKSGFSATPTHPVQHRLPVLGRQPDRRRRSARTSTPTSRRSTSALASRRSRRSETSRAPDSRRTTTIPRTRAANCIRISRRRVEPRRRPPTVAISSTQNRQRGAGAPVQASRQHHRHPDRESVR